MRATETVTLLNPDYYQAWNMRKRTILATPPSAELLQAELAFNVATIKKGPKSYYAWHHRRWFLALQPLSFDPAPELGLCAKLLDLDPRNFHCWNYRRWLSDRFRVPAQDEFDFTSQMVFRNFSNYSAWHRRTQLLDSAFPEASQRTDMLQRDLKLTQEAYWTAPADQSPWFYLRWLALRLDAPAVAAETAKIKELLVYEDDLPRTIPPLDRSMLNLGSRIAGRGAAVPGHRHHRGPRGHAGPAAVDRSHAPRLLPAPQRHDAVRRAAASR